MSGVHGTADLVLTIATWIIAGAAMVISARSVLSARKTIRRINESGARIAESNRQIEEILGESRRRVEERRTARLAEEVER